MFTRPLDNTMPRHYKGNGQHLEQLTRWNLTGEIVKADNLPFWAGADCGNLQIKSARATVCKGLDIQAHINRDAAECYGYVIQDGSLLYVMTPSEWLEFAETFKTIDHESKKNGGGLKTRLKSESKAMTEWLRRHAA